MKNILVLSFVHEDPLILKEFELLKDHYNKIIDYFCFPIKYYGVRATEEGETRIDEENQIIWLHTNNLAEYDKKLFDKTVDCFRFIKENGIDYDIIIKGNTSTYLNLIQLNKILQHNSLDTVYTGVKVETPNNLTIPCYGRGNCLCIPKKYIDIIVEADINKIKNKILSDTNGSPEWIDTLDDIGHAYIWKLNSNLNIEQISLKTVGYIYEFNILEDMDDILKVGAVCCKFYNIDFNCKIKFYNNVDFNKTLNMHPAIVLLKLVINFVENRYIIDDISTYSVVESWYNKSE